MTQMDSIWNVGLMAISSFGVFLGLVVAFPCWLYHRRVMVRLKGTNAREMAHMREKIMALQQRCEKLEEQVSTAHMLLADEQRQLDRKLASLLPDSEHARRIKDGRERE